MRSTTIACAVLFCLYLLPSVAGAQGKVVIGQTQTGDNVILQVIELKFLDPYVAVQLMEALGYGGAAIPVGPPSMSPGYNAPMRGQSNRPGYANRGSRSQPQQGYQGYQDANRRSEQYPGYQSPYDYR